MVSPLEGEFQYYLENQDRLVKQHKGKVLVIKNREVIGAYNSEEEALVEATKHHELGTFLVQRCEPGRDTVTQTFHSRVSFA